jgi:hypothetical protein
MRNGLPTDFIDSWRDTQEEFVHKLSRRHLGVELDNLEIRKYLITGSVADALRRIRRDHYLKHTMFRFRRGMKKLFS